MKQKGFAPILIVLLVALGIGGYLIYQKQAKPIPVPQPSPSPVTTPASSPTASSSATSPVPDGSGETVDWKTYISKDKSVLFMYPIDAKVTLGKAYSMLSSDPSDAVTIETPYISVDNQGYILNVVIRENLQNLPAKTVIDNYLSEVEKNCSPPACGLPQKVRSTLKEYTNSEVNGYTFRIGGETDSVMVVQVKNNKTYIFRISNGNGYATEQGIKIFDQILSTFKFTE